MMNRTKLTTIAGKMSMALALFIGVSAFAQVPRSKHVYIVAEENRSYEHIVGSASMPYLNSLINKGGLATQFYANQHGSLENYFWVTAGQKITDNNSTTAVFNVDNIERHLLTNGMTFKSYAQSLPYAGYTGLYYNAYLKRHAPLPYFTDMANSSLIKNHDSAIQMATDIANGDLLEIETWTGVIRWKGREFRTAPIPEIIDNILAAGSLIDYGRTVVAASESASS